MAIDYNRQYVGARYVPKFFENPNGSWDWAAGFQYEPLTMVQYGNNTYTSKKLVPSTVGAPNLNAEYWAQTGNYSGAIVNIQSQIDIINEQIDEWKSKHYLLITDSYGVVTDNLSNPWTITFKNTIESSGGTCDVMAQGGSGFVGNGSVPTFLDLLNSAPQNYYDVIIVQGFLNDMSNSVLAPTFNQAVVNFRQRMNTKFPNVKAYFLPVSKVLLHADAPIVRNMCSILLSNRLSAYMPAWGILSDSSQFQSDGAHPNSLGSNDIFKTVINMLTNGGYCNYWNNTDCFGMITPFQMNVSIKAGPIMTILKNGEHNFRELVEIPKLSLVNTSANFTEHSIGFDNNQNTYIYRLMQTGGKLYAGVYPVDKTITGSMQGSTFALQTISVTLATMFGVNG